MARREGTLKLTSNIEPRVAAPLDARSKVATLADLTTSGTFPYPYAGMEVYVASEQKKYLLIGDDPTISSNWVEGNNSGNGEITEGYYAHSGEWAFFGTRTGNENDGYEYGDKITPIVGFYKDLATNFIFFCDGTEYKKILTNEFFEYSEENRRDSISVGIDNGNVDGRDYFKNYYFGKGLRTDYETHNQVLLGSYNKDGHSGDNLVIGDGTEDNRHTMLASGETYTTIYMPYNSEGVNADTAISMENGGSGGDQLMRLLNDNVIITENEVSFTPSLDYNGHPIAIQIETVPVLSGDLEKLQGKTVQFIGDSNESFVNGHFYKYASDGEISPTYSWEEVDVSSDSTPHWSGTRAEYEAQKDNIEDGTYVSILDDIDTHELVDVVEKDNMNPVTSNAVYDANEELYTKVVNNFKPTVPSAQVVVKNEAGNLSTAKSYTASHSGLLRVHFIKLYSGHTIMLTVNGRVVDSVPNYTGAATSVSNPITSGVLIAFVKAGDSINISCDGGGENWYIQNVSIQPISWFTS